jgi:hypothetical protein
MKMDMELIRKLLIYIQDNIEIDGFDRSDTIKIEGYSKEQIIYHVALLNDNGYIQATCGRVFFNFENEPTWVKN